MKPIGIVFLVINLVLAGAFLGYSSHALKTSTNWKKQYDDVKLQLEQQLQEAEGRYSKSVTDLEAVTNNRNLLQETKNKTDATVKDLTAQLEAARSENGELNTQVSGINAQIGELKDTIGQITDSKTLAEEKRLEAEKSAKDALASAKEATRLQRNAEDELKTAMDNIGDLKVQVTAQKDQLSNREALLALYQEKTGVAIGSLGAAAQKLINGRVLSVDSSFSPGLVALNVGANDGVTKGMTFEIYAGTEYKGQVRVETVLQDKCSALIVRQSGGAITQNDYASTNL